MAAERRLGVSVPDMRKMAKELGKDHTLAIKLWKTRISEAMILAAMIDEPAKLTEKQMEEWVKARAREKTALAWKKIIDWSRREEEFVKRTAFALIACLAWHDKEAKDDKFIELFPLIKREAIDERNFVKKAVNWALRNIGKRNQNLNQAAINVAKDIRRIDSKSARWIALDAIKELESEAVQKRLRKRAR